MRCRSFLLGVLAGVCITVILSLFVQHRQREEFKQEAFRHGAMMYHVDVMTGKILKWEWMDDYRRLPHSTQNERL